MSKTKRRTKSTKDDMYRVTTDLVQRFESDGNWIELVRVPKEEKELAKSLARYYSDAGTHQCKEPGPSWYRRITRQVPLRRDSARQIRRYLQGEDLEVIIETKPPLEYWT